MFKYVWLMFSGSDENSAKITAGESRERVAAGEHSVHEIYWLTRFVWLAGALCVFVQLHSLAKLIGAFVCQDAIWNFPDRCAEVRNY